MSDACHATVVDEWGDQFACDRAAVGVRASVDYGDLYPVCASHLCGGCGHWHDRCTPIPPPPERAILQDLIAELRDFPLCSDNGGGDSGLCGADDLAGHLADRAEARLREVQGE